MTGEGGPPLSIGYHQLPEDWAAFNSWHADHSGAVRRQRRRVWMLGCFILFVVIVGSIVIQAYGLAITCVLLGVGILLLSRRRPSKDVAKLASSMYGEQEAGYGLGRQTLTIDTEWLELAGESWSQRVHLKWIRSIESGDTHVFIYYGPADAFYVPKQRITSGDLDAFVQELETQAKRVRAAPPS